MTTATSNLHLLAYTSEYFGTDEQIDADLASILSNAQLRNPGLGITGVMFYQCRRFLQFIEGPESSLRTLMQRIEKDPRHGQIRYLFDEPVPERGFEQWSMEAFNLSKSEKLDADLLVLIRDSYRANFVTCTSTVVGLYKGFIEQRLLS